MGIQHTENVPASFLEAFGDNYLGNPDLVNRLVSEFLVSAEVLLGKLGTIKPAEFREQANTLIKKSADIFSGRDSDYTVIVGYNKVSLGYKLMADLGEFWQKNRAKWNDDAVAVLFEYLLVMLAESLKKADGDEMLLEIMLKPSVQYAVKVLLGVEQRR